MVVHSGTPGIATGQPTFACSSLETAAQHMQIR